MPIGDNFANSVNLETMDLSFNNFSRDLPASFYTLTKLSSLCLQNNQLTGSISILSHLPLDTLWTWKEVFLIIVKTEILMYCTGGIRCDVYSTVLRNKGFKNLYTLEGGVSHYLENEGPVDWVGNLFVFDSRLSLPPSTYKPEAATTKAFAQQQQALEKDKFAKCYICGSLVHEFWHRNCANIDCNHLFL